MNARVHEGNETTASPPSRWVLAGGIFLAGLLGTVVGGVAADARIAELEAQLQAARRATDVPDAGPDPGGHCGWVAPELPAPSV